MSTFKKIDFPNLDQPNFGENLQEQFQNIDSNFQKLSNRDLWRGRDGRSCLYVPIDFNSIYINEFVERIANEDESIKFEDVITAVRAKFTDKNTKKLNNEVLDRVLEHYSKYRSVLNKTFADYVDLCKQLVWGKGEAIAENSLAGALRRKYGTAIINEICDGEAPDDPIYYSNWLEVVHGKAGDDLIKIWSEQIRVTNLAVLWCAAAPTSTSEGNVDYEVVGSLPYIYVDPVWRSRNIARMIDAAHQKTSPYYHIDWNVVHDISCVLTWEPDGSVINISNDDNSGNTGSADDSKKCPCECDNCCCNKPEDPTVPGYGSDNNEELLISGGFVVSEMFPQLYWRGGTFYWRINEAETGVPATGPAGAPGLPGQIRVVERVENVADAFPNQTLGPNLYSWKRPAYAGKYAINHSITQFGQGSKYIDRYEKMPNQVSSNTMPESEQEQWPTTVKIEQAEDTKANETVINAWGGQIIDEDLIKNAQDLYRIKCVVGDTEFWQFDPERKIGIDAKGFATNIPEGWLHNVSIANIPSKKDYEKRSKPGDPEYYEYLAHYGVVKYAVAQDGGDIFGLLVDDSHRIMGVYDGTPTPMSLSYIVNAKYVFEVQTSIGGGIGITDAPIIDTNVTAVLSLQTPLARVHVLDPAFSKYNYGLTNAIIPNTSDEIQTFIRQLDGTQAIVVPGPTYRQNHTNSDTWFVTLRAIAYMQTQESAIVSDKITDNINVKNYYYLVAYCSPENRFSCDLDDNSFVANMMNLDVYTHKKTGDTFNKPRGLMLPIGTPWWDMGKGKNSIDAFSAHIIHSDCGPFGDDEGVNTSTDKDKVQSLTTKAIKKDNKLEAGAAELVDIKEDQGLVVKDKTVLHIGSVKDYRSLNQVFTDDKNKFNAAVPGRADQTADDAGVKFDAGFNTNARLHVDEPVRITRFRDTDGPENANTNRKLLEVEGDVVIGGAHYDDPAEGAIHGEGGKYNQNVNNSGGLYVPGNLSAGSLKHEYSKTDPTPGVVRFTGDLLVDTNALAGVNALANIDINDVVIHRDGVNLDKTSDKFDDHPFYNKAGVSALNNYYSAIFKNMIGARLMVAEDGFVVRNGGKTQFSVDSAGNIQTFGTEIRSNADRTLWAFHTQLAVDAKNNDKRINNQVSFCTYPAKGSTKGSTKGSKITYEFEDGEHVKLGFMGKSGQNEFLENSSHVLETYAKQLYHYGALDVVGYHDKKDSTDFETHGYGARILYGAIIDGTDKLDQKINTTVAADKVDTRGQIKKSTTQTQYGLWVRKTGSRIDESLSIGDCLAVAQSGWFGNGLYVKNQILAKSFARYYENEEGESVGAYPNSHIALMFDNGLSTLKFPKHTSKTGSRFDKIASPLILDLGPSYGKDRLVKFGYAREITIDESEKTYSLDVDSNEGDKDRKIVLLGKYPESARGSKTCVCYHDFLSGKKYDGDTSTAFIKYLVHLGLIPDTLTKLDEITKYLENNDVTVKDGTDAKSTLWALKADKYPTGWSNGLQLKSENPFVINAEWTTDMVHIHISIACLRYFEAKGSRRYRRLFTGSSDWVKGFKGRDPGADDSDGANCLFIFGQGLKEIDQNIPLPKHKVTSQFAASVGACTWHSNKWQEKGLGGRGSITPSVTLSIDKFGNFELTGALLHLLISNSKHFDEYPPSIDFDFVYQRDLSADDLLYYATQNENPPTDDIQPGNENCRDSIDAAEKVLENTADKIYVWCRKYVLNGGNKIWKKDSEWILVKSPKQYKYVGTETNEKPTIESPSDSRCKDTMEGISSPYIWRHEFKDDSFVGDWELIKEPQKQYKYAGTETNNPPTISFSECKDTMEGISSPYIWRHEFSGDSFVGDWELIVSPPVDSSLLYNITTCTANDVKTWLEDDQRSELYSTLIDVINSNKRAMGVYEAPFGTVSYRYTPPANLQVGGAHSVIMLWKLEVSALVVAYKGGKDDLSHRSIHFKFIPVAGSVVPTDPESVVKLPNPRLISTYIIGEGSGSSIDTTQFALANHKHPINDITHLSNKLDALQSEINSIKSRITELSTSPIPVQLDIPAGSSSGSVDLYAQDMNGSDDVPTLESNGEPEVTIS